MKESRRFVAALACAAAAVAIFSAAAAGQIAVTIDTSANRRPVSRLIYGVSFGDDTQVAARHWPVRRWGGNSTTRYNWQTDVSNRANDWFFINEPSSAPPAQLPNGSAADVFMTANHSVEADTLLTIPTIGWTPIDNVKRWGMSIAKYGPQDTNECVALGQIPPYPSWCAADAGNGEFNYQPIVPLVPFDPTDTSVAVDQTFEQQWVNFIVSKFGTASQGGVRFYTLDNEVMLWNSTQRDAHDFPTSYDEVWGYTPLYAGAIKTADSSALVMGPVTWGWCDLFWSALDGCGEGGSDLQNHGGVHFVEWYLQQLQSYAASHGGQQLVDYLDVHWYPQGNNIALSDDESPATAQLRLRSIKNLYDPTYVDESWIGTAGWKSGIPMLIPRLKSWIAADNPGMKLAITEYNWGNDNGKSSALAQAEVMAIFGREGVDLATRWVAPDIDSYVQDAFDLYLNYDGAGAHVNGSSVSTLSADVDTVGAYAIQDTSGTLYVLLFNKDLVNSQNVAVSVAQGFPSASAELYEFDSLNRLQSIGPAPTSGNTLNLALVPESATLAVFTKPLATKFFTISPCRLVDTRSTSTAPNAGPALSAGVTRNFLAANNCGIPSTAAALSVNVTAVSPGSNGDLRIYAGDAGAPSSSAINFRAGDTRANNAVASLSGNGDGTFNVRADLASGTVNVIVDVNGYFR